MYRHHSFEERLNMISRLISGEPLRSLCKEFMLIAMKSGNGIFATKNMARKVFVEPDHTTVQLKKKNRIVAEYIVKGVPLQEICLRYNLNRSTVKIWIRKIREGKNLENKRRGRPPKDPMARPKKKEPQTELEKLQAENLRLRAENALLKKVKALVEEQEARERLSGQKPSTN